MKIQTTYLYALRRFYGRLFLLLFGLFAVSLTACSPSKPADTQTSEATQEQQVADTKVTKKSKSKCIADGQYTGVGSKPWKCAMERFETAFKDGDKGELQKSWDYFEPGDRLYVYQGGMKLLYPLPTTDKTLEDYKNSLRFFSGIDRKTYLQPGHDAGHPSGRFTGLIKDGKTRQPIADVLVVAGGQETLTGTDGSFSFENLPEGEFLIVTPHPGYTLNQGIVIVKHDKPVTKKITLYRDLKFEKLTGKQTLSGVLLDKKTGDPITGAEIIMALTSDRTDVLPTHNSRNAKSDAQGKFQITEIPAGSHQIIITKNPYYALVDKKVEISKIGKTEKTWRIERKEINLGSGIGMLSGQVVRDDTGEPISDVKISGEKYKSTTSDKTGSFRLRLTPGTPMVRLTHVDYTKFSKRFTIIKGDDQKTEIRLKPLQIANIEGDVVDADSGEPIVGADLTVQQNAVESDAAGHFVFEKIKSGEVKLFAVAKKYHSKETVLELKPLATLQTKVELSLITEGELTGLVINSANQQPLANVKISVGEKTISTDEAGRFILESIPGGKLGVSAEKPVFAAKSQTVEIIAAQKTDITIELDPITTGTLVGLVQDADTGKALAGVNLSIGGLAAISDKSGHFEIVDIPVGKAQVSAEKPVFTAKSQPVEIIAAQKTNITIELDPITTGILLGLVQDADTGKALASVSLSIGGLTTISDKSGHFEIIDVPVGKAQVSAEKPVFTAKSQPVEIIAAQETDITIELDPITTGTLVGLVQDADTGKALTGVNLSIGGSAAISDKSGHFEIVDIPAGKASLGATLAGYHSDTSNINIKAADTEETVVELKLVTTGKISGVVINASTGKPEKNVKIMVNGQSVKTDANGRFQLDEVDAKRITVSATKDIFENGSTNLNLKPGSEEILEFKLAPITYGMVQGTVRNKKTGKKIVGATVTLAGNSATTDAEGNFAVERVSAGQQSASAIKKIYQSQQQNFLLKAGDTVTVDFELDPITTASISGVAVDKKSQKPILGVRVSAGGKAAETDAQGAFSLEEVKSGEIGLRSQHPDYNNQTQTLDLSAGDHKEIRLELEIRREDIKALEAALRKTGSVDLYGIQFDSGKDQFKPSSLSTLKAVSKTIKNATGKSFQIAGHTDSDGAESYNQTLSERRAKTVIEWLIRDNVPSDQLSARGYGEAKPVAPNTTEAGKALNRRVQLRYLNTVK